MLLKQKIYDRLEILEEKKRTEISNYIDIDSVCTKEEHMSVMCWQVQRRCSILAIVVRWIGHTRRRQSTLIRVLLQPNPLVKRRS